MLMLDTKTSDFPLYILDYSRTCPNNYKSYKNENNDDADSNRNDNFKIIIWCSNFNKNCWFQVAVTNIECQSVTIKN